MEKKGARMGLTAMDKFMYTMWIVCMILFRYVPCFELGERLELALFVTVMTLMYTILAIWEEVHK